MSCGEMSRRRRPCRAFMCTCPGSASCCRPARSSRSRTATSSKSGPDELDLSRFEREVADARASLEAGDAERGSRVLQDALELWRGPALAEFAYEPFAKTEIVRLEELRVAALEERIEADLSLGRHADVIGELEALIDANPHGERPREQLMVALYRSGRQAEALEAYRAARARLDELGLEPGERLRQLEKAILTHDAVLTPPPEKTRRRAPTNLPVPATSLVGRKQQLADVTALLTNLGTRLVTLTGAAGSGKTRLALQAAYDLREDFPHGAFFVGLETVRDPDFVVPTIAKALGVTASPGEELALALRERLAERRLLIVLDNFEQVLDAAPLVAGLLTTRAAFLVTSRAPLRISAEREYPVPPLTLAEARELFVERARAVVPTFQPSPAVAEVCRRLDCLPLAIELAAARTKILSPAAILPRLDRRLSLLTGGPSDLPTRQRTLRAALDWSYELLTKPERRLFARLAVFAGGFDLAAAEEVAGADLDTLQALIDHGLVRVNGERFSFLDSIHEYAAERLDDRSDTESVRLQHGRYFASLGERLMKLTREGSREARRFLHAEVANLDVARTVLRSTSNRNDELRALEALALAQSLAGMKEETLRL